MKSTDRDRLIEIITIKIVRLITIFAVLFVVGGGILYLHFNGFHSQMYNNFNIENSQLRHLVTILKSAIKLCPVGIIQFGILFLIAIPVFRVIAYLVSFVIQRDWLYCFIAFIILFTLFFSFREFVF